MLFEVHIPVVYLENFLTRIGDFFRIDLVDVKSFVSLADCNLFWK